MNEQLKKRLKSFAWRASAVALSAVIVFFINHITEWGLTPLQISLISTVLGLINGEISKYLNQTKPNVETEVEG